MSQNWAMEGDNKRLGALASKDRDGRDAVDSTLGSYDKLFGQKDSDAGIQERKKNYMSMVNQFYDLVTDFYEYGWGQSFHFATRHRFESFEASIARHEMWLAHKMEMKPGQKILDIGCGVGGPMRCIARFSGANVVGINNNAYQLKRARILNEQAGLAHLCTTQQSDFMNLPFEDQSVDGAYEVEATCHAPDKTACYKEIFRTLKPGAYFGNYEWVMTPRYDPNNAEHVRIKEAIELGNGLPTLPTIDHVVECMKKAGFEVDMCEDVAEGSDLPWYLPLSAGFSFTGWKHTAFGRAITSKMVWMLETCKIAPAGSLRVQELLEMAAVELVKGGELGIFSPMLFVLARKPE